MDLEKKSIDSFAKLRSRFMEYFATARARKKRLSDLANMVQGENESNMSFYNRFRDLADSIEERLTDREIIVCFANGQRSDNLTYELSLREPVTKSELYHVAYATAIAEEKRKQMHGDRGRDREPYRGNENRSANGNSSQGTNGNRGKNRTRATEVFTPLIKPISEIMNLVTLPPPKPLKDNPKFPRDVNKYCSYHRDNGHDTDNCFALKKILQKWAEEGKLNDVDIPF